MHPSLCGYRELKLRVQDLVFCELESIYKRLATQQRERDAAGLLPKRATRTLLESRLVVEAKRRIDVHAIAANVRLCVCPLLSYKVPL